MMILYVNTCMYILPALIWSESHFFHNLLPCRLKEELQCTQSSCDASNEQKASLDAMLAKERKEGKSSQQVCECVYGERFATP